MRPVSSETGVFFVPGPFAFLSQQRKMPCCWQGQSVLCWAGPQEDVPRLLFVEAVTSLEAPGLLGPGRLTWIQVAARRD